MRRGKRVLWMESSYMLPDINCIKSYKLYCMHAGEINKINTKILTKVIKETKFYNRKCTLMQYKQLKKQSNKEKM